MGKLEDIMEFLGGLLALVVVLAQPVLLVGLIKPSWIKLPNRKRVLGWWLASFVSLGVAGAMLPTPEKTEANKYKVADVDTSQAERKPVEEDQSARKEAEQAKLEAAKLKEEVERLKSEAEQAKAVVVAPTAATLAVPYVPTGLSSSVGSAQKHTSDSSHHQYSCTDLTDSQAQVLMEAGHTYLDADGDGDACEPDPRRDYAPVAAKPSSGNCHWVEGYTRKNGTKVRGHTRCR